MAVQHWYVDLTVNYECEAEDIQFEPVLGWTDPDTFTGAPEPILISGSPSKRYALDLSDASRDYLVIVEHTSDKLGRQTWYYYSRHSFFQAIS